MPQYQSHAMISWYDIIAASLCIDREVRVYLKPPSGAKIPLAPIVSMDKVEINWSNGRQAVAGSGYFWSRDKKVPVEILGTIDINGWFTGTMSW